MMKTYNKNKTLFSIHIPKSGGTSFTEVLKKWFWPGFHAHYYRHEVGKMPYKPRKVKRVLHNFRLYPLCIHGHFEDEAGVFEFYPEADQFITLLRDPLELHLSLFYNQLKVIEKEGSLYWKGKQVDLGYKDVDEWLETRSSHMLKFFPWEMNENNFKNIIEHNFIHIGTTENLQNSIEILSKKLRKKNVNIPHLNTSKRTTSPSESSKRKFISNHKLEYEIYNYVSSING